VLAVIQDQEDSTRADGVDEQLKRMQWRLLIESDGRGYLLEDQVTPVHRRKVHEIDTVRPLPAFTVGELEGQARFAHSSNSDELDQSRRVEQIAESRKFSDAADEAGQGPRYSGGVRWNAIWQSSWFPAPSDSDARREV
jgi:hypothetical protein